MTGTSQKQETIEVHLYLVPVPDVCPWRLLIFCLFIIYFHLEFYFMIFQLPICFVVLFGGEGGVCFTLGAAFTGEGDWSRKRPGSSSSNHSRAFRLLEVIFFSSFSVNMSSKR